MRLVNDGHGYGAVTKTLHWLTALLLAAQVAVGYTMDDGSGRGRGRGRSGEDGGRGRGGEEDWAAFDGDLTLLDVHLALGLALAVVVALRIWWRSATPLPPWDARLGPAARRWLPWVERGLLATLLLAPLTGIALVVGDDDLLPLHVASHVALYALLAAHLAVVVARGLVPRMLPGRAGGATA